MGEAAGRSPCSDWLPTGVNIGGAGSYIYEKPCAEGPQVTGPIEVPVVRAEERKASGPPKGPSKGGLGSVWGRRGVLVALPCPDLWCHSWCVPQPPASPRSRGSPTCVLAVTRGSTLVSDCGRQQPLGGQPRRVPSFTVSPPSSREGDLSGQGLAPPLPAL